MRIQVDEKKKLAVIWLTNADQADQEQQEELRSLYQEYSAKKYTVAVFRSGQEDLVPLTSHLLSHNRVCAAKAELSQEEQGRRAQNQQLPEREQEYQGPTMMFG